jgi:hypothetical protein
MNVVLAVGIVLSVIVHLVTRALVFVFAQDEPVVQPPCFAAQEVIVGGFVHQSIYRPAGSFCSHDRDAVILFFRAVLPIREVGPFVEAYIFVE